MSNDAKKMVEQPLELIEMILIRHQEAILEVCREQQEEISRLRKICRDAYEVWAGSEGFPKPTTASEAYVLQQLCLMRDEVKKGLK